jgi:hypothetical protein
LLQSPQPPASITANPHHLRDPAEVDGPVRWSALARLG